jgi:hypothetical protein
MRVLRQPHREKYRPSAIQADVDCCARGASDFN